MMLRRKGWRMRLAATLEAIGTTPHQWGVHDCAVGLAARCIEAITGTDLAAPWRGQYGTEHEALNLLQSSGMDGLEEAVTWLLEEIPVGDARIGDIAFIRDGSLLGGFLGVFNGERLIVLRADGKGTLDRSAAALAFKVGE